LLFSLYWKKEENTNKKLIVFAPSVWYAIDRKTIYKEVFP